MSTYSARLKIFVFFIYNCCNDQVDLVEKYGKLQFSLDYYTDVLDLEYLATFLARVPRLELYQGPGGHTEFHGLIHLAGLDQLRAVTFTKLPVHLIQDLVQVRESLESLALHRCCFSLDSLVS